MGMVITLSMKDSATSLGTPGKSGAGEDKGDPRRKIKKVTCNAVIV